MVMTEFCNIRVAGVLCWRQSARDPNARNESGERVAIAATDGRRPPHQIGRHERPIPIHDDGPRPPDLDGGRQTRDEHTGTATVAEQNSHWPLAWAMDDADWLIAGT